MTYAHKKEVVLKWLSLSGYRRSNQTLEFLKTKLSDKYSHLNVKFGDEVLKILTELEVAGLVDKSHHKERSPTENDYYYFTNINGDAYVQGLPNISNEINNDATIDLLHLFLRYFPSYGPFEEASFTRHTVPPSLHEAFKLLAGNDGLLARLFLYLTDNGFATYRTDIKYGNTLYIELTDKGRSLKRCGSIYVYLNQEREETDSKRHQKKRDIYLFWVVVFGAVGTCISALNDGAQFLDFYKDHTPNWLFVAYFSSGLVAGLLVWLLVTLLGKSISKLRKVT